MSFNLAGVATFVISSERHDRVREMTRHLAGLHPTWVVPVGQAARYKQAGATNVVGVPGGLCRQRNAALDRAHGQGQWCLQLDDDLRRLAHWDGEVKRPITVGVAATMIGETMTDLGAKHGGCAPTDNAYFSRRPVTTKGFVIGCLTLTAPCEQRYDTELTLKEDWDYTCQHLRAYNVVARRDDILATFVHYTNTGGVQRYRTAEREADAVDVLLERWPGLLKPHSRRPNELAMIRA